MDKDFYMERESNFFDNLLINVGELYERFPVHAKTDPKPCLVQSMQSNFHKIYRNRMIPLRYRDRFWQISRRLNLDLTWFDEFRSYWSTVLKGRPLFNVHDFYFLRNLYRVRFQNNQVPDTSDACTHLEAWQRPELIYMLFHQVLKESISNQHPILELMWKYADRLPAAILEFGCGTAPIATSLFEFCRPKNQEVFIADIQTVAFHYAAYKFRSCSDVIPLLLLPQNDFLPSQEKALDVVFCITVFEHLNKPLETVDALHRMLKRDGLLFFDYVKGLGCGLDTRQGTEQRSAVLDFISKHFDIVHGQINKEETTFLTVARKR